MNTNNTPIPSAPPTDTTSQYDWPLPGLLVAKYSEVGFKTVLDELDYALRYDVRARRITVKSPGSTVFEPMTDVHQARIRLDAREAFQYSYTLRGKMQLKEWAPARAEYEDLVKTEADSNKVDGWKADYLSNLPDWDGKHRCESLIENCWPDYIDANPEILPNEATELVRWVGRYCFLAPIQRAYEPGSDLREMPVLIGPQSGGKSSLVRWLVRNDKRWFTDAVALDQDSKTNDERTAGKVLVEIAEMTGNRRADVQRMKSWLSSHEDGASRAVYARHPAPQPRRWVGIGTANDTGTGVLPNDPSGNFRFVAVGVGTATTMPWRLTDATRDQCFAEALHKYKAVDEFPDWKTAELPKQLVPAQKIANKVATTGSMIVDEALAQLSHRDYTPDQLVSAVLDAYPTTAAHRPTERQVYMAATAAGWTRARVMRNGKRFRLWHHPEAVTT